MLLAISTSAKRGKHSRRNNTLRMANQKHDYLNWINRMSSRNHSVFQEAKNKLEPCKFNKVNKNLKYGDVTTVQEAIDSIPIINSCRVVISISPGTYREKIEIPATMAYITLEGVSSHKTTIKWDDTADRTGKDGQPMGTFAVNSPYFIAKNITFKNVSSTTTAIRVTGKQAVALRISADTADHKGRHYFKNCYIQGSVDFLFGNGLSFYENCHLRAKTKGYGALTAQKRESLLEETGILFSELQGPGANHGDRVKWSRELTELEAKPFISLSFIDGSEWLLHI
ncbi:unnamed protein product [Withania somnifera]